jgi:hypothetical protein
MCRVPATRDHLETDVYLPTGSAGFKELTT